MKIKHERNIDRLQRWQNQLQAIANEMDMVAEIEQNNDIAALSAHIDSITDDIEFQKMEILGEGPIVQFKDGACVVRPAAGK